jgi:uncharacterized protein (TIGR02145 family)
MKAIYIPSLLGFLCASILSAGTVTDIDGNVYQTVTIGTQEWMAENLKVTHYRNGDVIPNVTDGTAWTGLTTGAYCEYNNDVSNVATYGRLYNWYAVVDSRNMAPVGWHVPTDAEWQTLVDYLGGDAVAGGKMKEAGTSHWLSPNSYATNESGFSALPAGCRYHLDGHYDDIPWVTHLWSSTEYSSTIAWYRYLDYDHSRVARVAIYNKALGLSIRCVKDCICIGLTGNVDCDPANGTDISDLSALIDNLYISFTPLCCPAEANTDGQPGTDISDLSALIDYLYISFTPPAVCQ